MVEVSNTALFLPALQLPAKRSQIHDAYRDSISQCLERAKPSDNTSTNRLDIILLTDGGSVFARHLIFASFQTYFAEVYTLICTCAAKLSIDLDFPGGVDVRVLALDLPCSNAEKAKIESAGPTPVSTTGPLATMTAWSTSRRSSYHHAYEVNQFALPLREREVLKYWHPHDSPNSSIPVEILQVPIKDAAASKFALHDTVTGHALSHISGKSHTRIAVGGTFDHLHVGHKLLLEATIFLAQPGPQPRQITIGITGDELLVTKKHASVLESWDTRQQRVAEFVESILIFAPNVTVIRTVSTTDDPGPNGKAVKVTYTPDTIEEGGTVTIDYVRISDPFGPTITDEDITALIISAETRAGGKAVNDKRVEKGWAELEVFEVDVLDAGSSDVDEGEGQGGEKPEKGGDTGKTLFESKISSTEIRRRIVEMGASSHDDGERSQGFA